jgi:hypothetical protein
MLVDVPRMGCLVGKIYVMGHENFPIQSVWVRTRDCIGGQLIGPGGERPSLVLMLAAREGVGRASDPGW